MFACGGQPWVTQPDNGSTVVYEPARPFSKPATPTRKLAAPAPLQHPSAPAFIEPPRGEVRKNGSVVRYEPIVDDSLLDADYDPASPFAADTAHTSPSAPIEDEPEHSSDGCAGSDLPLEDRPGTKASDRSLRPDRGVEVDASVFGLHLTADGLAFPYPTTHMFRGFGACRGHRHTHEAIDLGGVGPDWGIGTPIRSMARSEVIFVGSGDDKPEDFGTPDKRDGDSLRGDKNLPRWKDIEPYGRVYFFTSRQGRWRSGNLIVTRVLEGPLAGHTIRYLHVAAVHPDVKVGSVVALGQEIALMGGTGVQESAPHLHLDIQSPNGRRLDVAPLLGLEPTASCKVRGDDDEHEVRAPKVVRSRLDDSPTRVASKPGPKTSDTGDDKPTLSRKSQPDIASFERKSQPDMTSLELRDLVVGRCKATTRHEDFTSGRYVSHTTDLKLAKGQKLTIEVGRKGGTWKPRLQIDGDGITTKTLATGKIGAKAVTTVTANADTSVRVKVGGWTTDLPSDAAYALSVSEKCRGRK